MQGADVPRGAPQKDEQYDAFAYRRSWSHINHIMLPLRHVTLRTCYTCDMLPVEPVRVLTQRTCYPWNPWEFLHMILLTYGNRYICVRHKRNIFVTELEGWRRVQKSCKDRVTMVKK